MSSHGGFRRFEKSLSFQEKTVFAAEFQHVTARHAISISCLIKEVYRVHAGSRGDELSKKAQHEAQQMS